MLAIFSKLQWKINDEFARDPYKKCHGGKCGIPQEYPLTTDFLSANSLVGF